MPSPNTVLTADSYVQDGLVFQLDGIDYGGIDGQWIDRIQHAPFIATIPIEHNDGAFVFNENTSFLADRIVDDRAYSQIECVVQANRASNRVVVFLSNRRFFWLNKYEILFWAGTTHKATQQPFEPIMTISNYRQVVVLNGKNINTATSLTPRISSDRSRLGFIDSYYKSFVGKLYAIRVYSRQLSDREILINQKIDNARFELGLNIPDEVLPASRSLSLSEPFELPDESMTEQDFTNETSDER